MNARPDLSRWLPFPDGVRAGDPSTLPAGFRAGGASAGSKPSGALDLGVLVCDAPAMTSAARFTPSATAAAPVVITRDRCDNARLRGVLVNSGNANASTGKLGFEEAARMQGAASILLGLPVEQVALCSTGKIGEPLDGRIFVQTLPRVGDDLSADPTTWNQAISTTDVFLKHAAVDVALAGGTVRIVAQAKGAGMIHRASRRCWRSCRPTPSSPRGSATACSPLASGVPSTGSRSTARCRRTTRSSSRHPARAGSLGRRRRRCAPAVGPRPPAARPRPAAHRRRRGRHPPGPRAGDRR